MIPRRSQLLAILAGALALVVVAEWLFAGEGTQLSRPAPAFPTAAAGALSDADVSQWASIVLARPLLSQNRRPAPPPGAAVSDTLPRLSAIIVVGGTRHAIFSESGQKPQLAAEGDTIGVYRIRKVGADKVDLLGPNGPLSMKPSFIPAAPDASTAASQ